MVKINFKNQLNTINKANNKASKPSLVYNQIHNVKLINIARNKFTAKDGKKYDVLKMKFNNDCGEYEHTIYKFREEDFSEQTSPFLKPASYLNHIFILQNLLNACEAGLSKELEELDLPETVDGVWDTLCNFIIAKVKPFADDNKEMQIKLFGKISNAGKITAQIHPYIYSYAMDYDTKETTDEIINKFGNMIGHNLGFNKQEEYLIKKFNEKKIAVGLSTGAPKPKPTGIEALMATGVTKSNVSLNKPEKDDAYNALDNINIGF